MSTPEEAPQGAQNWLDEGYVPPWLNQFRPGPSWRFYDYDPVSNVVQWALPQDDQLVIHTQVLGTELLMRQCREAEAASAGMNWGDGRRIASVPHSIAHSSGLMQAVREKDKKFIQRWMNDPENRAWRTFRGKV